MTLEIPKTGPEFLSAVNAREGLESPQAVLSWVFAGLETPITEGVPWDWSSLNVRRSVDRYPESKSEGLSILSEAFTNYPSTSIADLTPEALKESYYSLFLTYREHATNAVALDQDIRRLGTEFAGVVEDERREIIPEVTDGSSAATTALSSATSTFLADGVQAGFFVEIDEGGADDGFYRIVSVDSENTLTLSAALTLTATGINFRVYTDHDNVWIAGIDYWRRQMLWLWDSRTQKCDYKIDLSGVLGLDEKILGLGYAGVVAGTRSISVITNLQYLRVPDNVLSPSATDVLVQWSLAGSGLTPGYRVRGVALDPTVIAVSDVLYVLDSANVEIVELVEATGALVAPHDISALSGVSALRGLALNFTTNEWVVGNHNYAYTITVGALITGNEDVDSITYFRDILTADLGCSSGALDAVNSCYTVNGAVDRIQRHTLLISGRGGLWQQPPIPDVQTVALYHLDEAAGAVVDAGPYANNAANSGMTQGAAGQFANGYEATAPGNSINIAAISSDFTALGAGTEGSLSLWFKASEATTLTAGTHVIADMRVDANNLVRIGIDAGLLTFEYVAGGVSKLVTAAHPSAGNSEALARWHQYTITWSSINDQVIAYVGGVQFGATQTGLGMWAGSLVMANVGAAAAAALGVYDDVHVSATPRTIPAQQDSTTSANRMHTFIGRDYDATYEPGDPLGFHYRDELFTEKFMGGNDFITRNDYGKAALSPPNLVMEDSEVVFRGPTPELGDLGRLSRMIGLFLDRIADTRERHLATMQDRHATMVEDISNVAEYLGIPGMDIDNWNVDMQRRFLRIMPLLLKRGGRAVTYTNFARLLGYLISSRTLQARRRWDSVTYSAAVPLLDAIPFDTMGAMDTASDTFPAALLRFCIYQLSVRSTAGETSAVTTERLLTDATATFRDTCQIGNLISVNNPNNAGDDGDYTVIEIHSDTVLKVDRDWPVGGLSGLTYTGNWEVPRTDPYGEALLSRFSDVAPDAMTLTQLECKIVDELPGSSITPGDGLHPRSGGYVTP